MRSVGLLFNFYMKLIQFVHFSLKRPLRKLVDTWKNCHCHCQEEEEVFKISVKTEVNVFDFLRALCVLF